MQHIDKTKNPKISHQKSNSSGQPYESVVLIRDMPKLTRTHLKELPLRPYPGYVLVTKNRKAFERASKELFNRDETDTGTQKGRFVGGSCWYHPFTYLVWYSAPETLAHELAHVILEIFGIIGIDPSSSGGEPFCYMLSQLIMEANQK